MVFGPAWNRRFLGSGRPRRPQKPFQKVGGEARPRKPSKPAQTPRIKNPSAKFKIKITPRIRPKTLASEGKRQSGPSLGTPRGEGDENKSKNVLTYCLDVLWPRLLGTTLCYSLSRTIESSDPPQTRRQGHNPPPNKTWQNTEQDCSRQGSRLDCGNCDCGSCGEEHGADVVPQARTPPGGPTGTVEPVRLLH